MQVKMSALVTGPDGFVFEETRRFENVSAAGAAQFRQSQKKVLAFISKEQGSTDGPLTATLDASFDGNAEPQVVVTGLTEADFVKFERFFYRDVIGDWLDFGEKKAGRHKIKGNAKH